MPVGAMLGLGAGAAGGGLAAASAIGGIASAAAAARGAKAQSNAAQADMDFQRETRDMILQRLKPYEEAGGVGNQAFLYEMGLGTKPTLPGGMEYGGFTKTPGYDFRLREGQDAIQASAAARGGLNSGATMQALQRDAQDYASAEYGNFLGRLGGLQALGVNAAQMSGNAAQNAAAGISNAFADLGNARSAGAVGMSNALNTGINNITGIWKYQQGLANPQQNRNVLAGIY